MFTKDLEVRVTKEGSDFNRVGIVSRLEDAQGRVSVKFGGRGRPKLIKANDLQAVVLETN